MEGLPKFFEYPLLSQERIKLRTSNFVCTFLVSIGTKAVYKFREKQPGAFAKTLETFQGTHILGASRGRLCDSKAFLLTRAVLSQGGLRDAAVLLDTYRIIQRHPAVFLPRHAFLVGLCLQTTVNYLSKSGFSAHDPPRFHPNLGCSRCNRSPMLGAA